MKKSKSQAHAEGLAQSWSRNEDGTVFVVIRKGSLLGESFKVYRDYEVENGEVVCAFCNGDFYPYGD